MFVKVRFITSSYIANFNNEAELLWTYVPNQTDCVKTKGLSLRVPMFFIGMKQSCSFFRIFKIATSPDFVGILAMTF
jgi:hypothetical protein